jgi:hypothetical protein
MWASVYDDAATTAVFVGRITAVDDTLDTITISTTIKTGTAPAVGATGKSIRVSGAWYGPYWNTSITDSFPFGFVNGLLTNTSLHSPRINVKGTRLYAVTNLVVESNGPIRFEGYTNTPGDLGLAHFSGASAGNGFTVISNFGNNIDICNFLIESNGVNNAVDGVVAGIESSYWRVCARGMRRAGLASSSTPVLLIECEFATNNAANSGSYAGVYLTAANTLVRCFSHHNAGANTSGFTIAGSSTAVHCIAASNTLYGFNVTAASAANGIALIGCDAYNNGSNGFASVSSSASMCYLDSPNGLDNGGWLVNIGGALRNGYIFNTGVGAGTMANLGTFTNLTGVSEIGTVTYANNTTPWVDQDNGDFRINSAAAINAGRGSYLQVSSGYTGTVGYPDIGAAQATNSGSGGIVGLPLFRR